MDLQIGAYGAKLSFACTANQKHVWLWWVQGGEVFILYNTVRVHLFCGTDVQGQNTKSVRFSLTA